MIEPGHPHEQQHLAGRARHRGERSLDPALQSRDPYRMAVVGAAEALVPVFVGFACLAFAWLLVAVGMSRSREAI